MGGGTAQTWIVAAWAALPAWLWPALAGLMAVGLGALAWRRRAQALRDKVHGLGKGEVDALTGLINRPHFEELLLASAREGSRPGQRHEAAVAVVVLGLDDFRTINDGYGHAAGDAVLVKAAKRLSDLVGGRPCVSRIGGDEFAVHVAADPERAARIAQRMLHANRMSDLLLEQRCSIAL